MLNDITHIIIKQLKQFACRGVQTVKYHDQGLQNVVSPAISEKSWYFIIQTAGNGMDIFPSKLFFYKT